MIDPGNEGGASIARVHYSTVNFEPYNQATYGGPSVASGTWQNWNVMNGYVWGTHLTGAPISAPISWSAFVAEYPNATILPVGSGGGVGFNVGSNWSAMTGNVGDFTFGTSAGTTAYTFDPTAPTTTTTTTPTTSSIVLGNSSSDSATVTGNPVVGSPTGTVQFYECGPTASPAACTSTAHTVGTAVTVTAGADNTSTASSVAFTPTGVGYWCFAGYYSGDTNYAASADTTTDECFNVTQTSSSTSTAPSVTTEAYGGGLLFDSATVTGTAAAFPTGNVQFYECGPTSNPVACNSSSGTPLSLDQTSKLSASQGIANSSGLTATSAGYWCFAGYYQGGANYTASSDATADECVNVTLAHTSTTSKPTNTTIELGQANTDLATVATGGNVEGGSPTGTVSFYECGPTSTPVACTSKAHRVGSPVTVSPKAGETSTATSASFTPTAVGYWCFAARYSGDGGYAASTNTAVNECVNVKGPVAIVTTSLPRGTLEKPYSATLAARGGTKPYVWSHTGKLPLGVHMSGSGVISGTPRKSGSFPIVIKVRDSSKPPTSATKSLTLVINS